MMVPEEARTRGERARGGSGMVMAWRLLAVLIAVAWGAAPVLAQTAYPSKPVRLVVPYPPGSGGDVVARLMAQKLGETWKQAVIVDNRPGASGAIGTQAVAKSPADGYTLLAATAGDTVLSPIINPRAGLDPMRELRPVSLVAVSPLVLVAQASFPANTLRELVALAKAKPGAIFYGTSGVGSAPHFAGELIKLQTGMNLGVVNYAGVGPAINALLGGQIQLAMAGFPPVSVHVKSGRLKVIGVLASRRSPLEPDWPLLGAGSSPGQDITNWVGLFAPAQTPTDIVATIAREAARILQQPEVVERMRGLGAEARGNTPEEFSTFLKGEDTMYRTTLKESGLNLE